VRPEGENGRGDSAIFFTRYFMYELQNHLEVETPLGNGKAILIESKDNDYYWTVVLFDSCAIVTFQQNQIKVVRNYSLGWGKFAADEMKNIINANSEK
jgi:hypothetical protein